MPLQVFSRASRTLRGATQVVTFLSVRDKKIVAGPIADQSQSVVGAIVDCSSPTGTSIKARP